MQSENLYKNMFLSSASLRPETTLRVWLDATVNCGIEGPHSRPFPFHRAPIRKLRSFLRVRMRSA